MSANGLIYNDEIIDGIRKMSFSTNVLEKYDNVTYHCALFAFNFDNQIKYDESFAKLGGLPSDFFEDSNRIYLARDGVTTKFSIKNFSLKNTFGNINSPLNISTYEMKIKLVETYSCIFANALEALAHFSGYDTYINRPYWFEIWFSGFKHDTLEPVSRIPLPNGMDSIIYKGCFTNVKSHLESSGTTWDISFAPSSISLLNKNTNLFSVPVLAKNDTPLTLKDFMDYCSNQMFKRFLSQLAKNEKDVKKIMSYYNGDKFISIRYKLPNDNKFIISESNNKVGDEVIKEKKEEEQSKQNEQANNSKEQTITSQSGSAHNTDAPNAKNINDNKMVSFTTACQDFLFSTKKYKSYIAKYDIETIPLKQSYNKMGLNKYVVTITLLKDRYIAEKLAEMKNQNSQKYDRTQLFYECRNDGSLIKKYQYGYSGADTSVLEVFNNYDMLFYMNALPQSTLEYNRGNVGYKNNTESNTNNREEEINIEEYKYKASVLNNFGSNYDIANISSKDINEINESYNNFNKQINDPKTFSGTKLNGYLEDIYKDSLYNAIKGSNLFYKISGLNKIPELNNDNTNNIDPTTALSNTEEQRESYAAKLLWERLYKSGQMTTTKFTILGDPYWIASQAYIKIDAGRTEDDVYKERLLIDNSKNYRCVFTIRSTPDQNNNYTKQNPTDWDFEFSIHASGIYQIIDCESIFEEGKFTQKLTGALDYRFIKEDD